MKGSLKKTACDQVENQVYAVDKYGVVLTVCLDDLFLDQFIVSCQEGDDSKSFFLEFEVIEVSLIAFVFGRGLDDLEKLAHRAANQRYIILIGGDEFPDEREGSAHHFDIVHNIVEAFVSTHNRNEFFLKGDQIKDLRTVQTTEEVLHELK